MQRRDFVKFAPAAALAAAVPTTALAETLPVDDGPVILWQRGEEILQGFPEARVTVYKDGYQIGGWHVGKTNVYEHDPRAGRIVGLDSSRRVVQVLGLDGAPVELTYDAVTVRAPLDIGDAMRDANALPRHWVNIAEPRKQELLEGFERISFEAFLIEGANGAFSVEHHIVACPFELGSAMWFPVSGYHERDGAMVAWATATGAERLSRKMSRVIFPRLAETSDGKISGEMRMISREGRTARELLLPVAERMTETGFMDAPPNPRSDAWKIVWVEYHCTGGGIEHVIAGLPAHWESEIPLSVMVHTKVG
jgi:hypothetical protein